MTIRMQNRVLFLCTGNYYRSRFAEILFNSVAGKMGLPWMAMSAVQGIARLEDILNYSVERKRIGGTVVIISLPFYQHSLGGVRLSWSRPFFLRFL